MLSTMPNFLNKTNKYLKNIPNNNKSIFIKPVLIAKLSKIINNLNIMCVLNYIP